MTFLARPSELPLMLVVTAVASVTSRRRCGPLDILVPMAGMTMQAGMGAGQGEFRLFVVIESPAGPAVRIVTCGAIRTEAAFMVLVLVASRAGPGHILERGRAMAILAGDHRMQANQRKAGQIVVEGDLLPPACFIVALLALCAELSGMRIIFLVAGHASRAQLVTVDLACVA